MGITHALAYQWRSALATDTTSRGPVDWDSTVVIVVAAKSGGVERTFQATFTPTVLDNPYQCVLAAGQGVSVNTRNSTSPSVLELTGRVWHPVAADADTAWTKFVDWETGSPIKRGAAPMPLLDDGFGFNQRLAAAEIPNDEAFVHHSDGDYYSLKLAGSDDGRDFGSPAPPNKENEDEDQPEYGSYTFFVGARLDVEVKRVAIWLVPEGVCFRNRVTVRADDGILSTLVIVAKPNGRDPRFPNRGIWFQGGLRVSDDVHVYLVSDGDISVVHLNDEDRNNAANRISIVAGGRIEIGGPESGSRLELGYDASSMDDLAETLLAMGALPQVVGGTGTNFAVKRQTWLETTPR
jgi:hypothetical protein